MVRPIIFFHHMASSDLMISCESHPSVFFLIIVRNFYEFKIPFFFFFLFLFNTLPLNILVDIVVLSSGTISRNWNETYGCPVYRS